MSSLVRDGDTVEIRTENVETFNMEGPVNAEPEQVLSILSDFNSHASRSVRYRPSETPETQVLREYSDVPSITFFQSKILKKPVTRRNVEVQIVRHVVQIPVLGAWTDTILYIFPATIPPRTEETGNVAAELHWIQFDEETFNQIGGEWRETCGIDISDEDLFTNSNEDLYGFWRLDYRTAGGTQITYLNHIDPGSLGRFVIDNLVARLMPEMPKSLMVIREALGLLPRTEDLESRAE